MKPHRLSPAISAPFPCEIKPRLYRWIEAARRISLFHSSELVVRFSKSASGTWTVIVMVFSSCQTLIVPNDSDTRRFHAYATCFIIQA